MSSPPPPSPPPAPREALWEPYDHLARMPGKGMRARHIAAFSEVLQVSKPYVEKVGALVNKLHTVSLLLDDVEDHAVLRRGQPASHCLFGVPRTINSASFVLLNTLRAAVADFPNQADTLYDELLALHEGQGWELYWRDCRICPNLKQYREMVVRKTGGLYRLAVRLLQHESEFKSMQLVPIADQLGLLYQIQDDLLNLSSEKYAKNKGFAEDITEGKYSFPVVHMLQGMSTASTAQVAELEQILAKHPTDTQLKLRAIELLRAAGSLDYTKRMLREYYTQTESAILNLGLKNPKPLLNLLQGLVAESLQPF